MALIPYEPLRHLENMRRELDRFFTTDFPTMRTGFGENFGTPSALRFMKRKMKWYPLVTFPA